MNTHAIKYYVYIEMSYCSKPTGESHKGHVLVEDTYLVYERNSFFKTDKYNIANNSLSPLHLVLHRNKSLR